MNPNVLIIVIGVVVALTIMSINGTRTELEKLRLQRDRPTAELPTELSAHSRDLVRQELQAVLPEYMPTFVKKTKDAVIADLNAEIRRAGIRPVEGSRS